MPILVIMTFSRRVGRGSMGVRSDGRVTAAGATQRIGDEPFGLELLYELTEKPNRLVAPATGGAHGVPCASTGLPRLMEARNVPVTAR